MLTQDKQEEQKKPERYVGNRQLIDLGTLALVAILLLIVGIIFNFMNIASPIPNEILHTTAN